ncbi:CHAD domain-containing protein [Noviherbaspirillum saxi]|nr:CHAD domain-containing protein [Noviherbaspirillum saxi]
MHSSLPFASQPLAAVKATHVKLSKHLTVAQAFQEIATNCLAQIRANEAAVAQTHHEESLHQMRVGLRRLRSLLGLFNSMLQLPDEVQHEINWLAEELGIARDWDVLAGSTLPVAASIAAEIEFEPVRLATKANAQERHEAVAAVVRSDRYFQLVLFLTNWVQTRSWREAISPSNRKRMKTPIIRFAKISLKHAQRRLHKRGRRLKEATPEARHRVRIAAKKARYATEFFQSLYPTRKTKPYVRALSQLQNELGWMNDVAVGDRLLKELQEEQDTLAGTAAYIRGYLAGSVEADKKQLEKLWKKFKVMKLPV